MKSYSARQSIGLAILLGPPQNQPKAAMGSVDKALKHHGDMYRFGRRESTDIRTWQEHARQG